MKTQLMEWEATLAESIPGQGLIAERLILQKQKNQTTQFKNEQRTRIGVSSNVL